jgi:hypothetical protein
MRKHLFIAIVLLANCISGLTQGSSQKPIVLRGTIILPNNVTKHGYVAIVNGRIASVSEDLPDIPGAITVNTHGIILPGFVDVHNHVRFNVLPRWKPGRLFTNRNQWRADPEVLRLVNGPIGRLESSHFCDMNKWGELRALVGGTTSIMTTQSQSCIHGLVRNLDLNSGFYGTTELDREHIFNVLDLPPASDPASRAAFVGAARFFIANPFYEALFIHLAEGTDAAAEEEFTFMQSQSLLNPKGVVIHGIPLSPADFRAMAVNGTALVWSPRSNLELYGKTADILAALDAGVEIALAPDWAITGSSNMLAELKVAAQWNREQLGGRLTDRQLVDMVTSVPAHIAGVEDHVGAISVGLRADITVINGDHNNPLRAVIDATAAEVELVFIDGVALYGDRIFMEHFWNRSDLEEINLSGVTKTLSTPAANVRVNDIGSRLGPALETEGTSLAPLTEPDDFDLPAVGMRAGMNIINRKIPTTKANDITRKVEKINTGKLTVTALPNPSRKYFTIRIESTSVELMHFRVHDMSGRIVEARNGIGANTTFHIGSDLQPGIYVVEVVQGAERQMFKLIRQ